MSAHAQLPLAGLTNEVREGFDAGYLAIIAEPTFAAGRDPGQYAGDERHSSMTKLRLVHIVHRARGGEVRGYVQIEGESILRVRGPRYSNPPWPEMDAEVARLMGMEVVAL